MAQEVKFDIDASAVGRETGKERASFARVQGSTTSRTPSRAIIAGLDIKFNSLTRSMGTSNGYKKCRGYCAPSRSLRPPKSEELLRNVIQQLEDHQSQLKQFSQVIVCPLFPTFLHHGVSDFRLSFQRERSHHRCSQRCRSRSSESVRISWHELDPGRLEQRKARPSERRSPNERVG